MTSSCKGRCTLYKTSAYHGAASGPKRRAIPAKYGTFGRGYYTGNRKRCSICCVYIEWEGHRCPCCSMTLRTRPTNAGSRHTRAESFVKRI